MLYSSLKFLMRFALKVYYRKVFLLNEDRIPYEKPYIFACNHPNAFTDAILVAALTRRDLYFLARSDVFNNKLNIWLLGLINLIPIYRLQEGSESLLRNQETFELCSEILNKGNSILIFSEGISLQDRRLRQLKKGTARIAFGSLMQSDGKLDLHIVPVGINYTHPNNFRSEVIISFGNSLRIKDYYNRYLLNKAKAINEFNCDLAQKIENEVVVVNDFSREATVDSYLDIIRNNHPVPSYPWISRNVSRLMLEKRLANFINNMDQNDYSELKSKLGTYFVLLKHARISDRSLIAKNRSVNKSVLVLLLIGVLALIGAILNFLPFVLTKFISSKFVKKGEFYSGVNICAGSLLFIIYYGIGSILLVLYFGWLGVLLNGIPLALGVFSLVWWEVFKAKRDIMIGNRILERDPELFNRLLQLREEIQEFCLPKTPV